MPQITEADWKKQEKQLNAAIRKARKASTRNVTLAEKIELKSAVQAAVEALRQHRLNYHALVHGALPFDTPITFYMQDSRQLLGKLMMWWAENGGYVSDIQKAKVFTRSKAIQQHESRSSDIPWPKAYVDPLSIPEVDHQVVKWNEAMLYTPATDPGSFYVQSRDQISGNSLVWKDKAGNCSPNLRDAGSFSREEALALKAASATNIPWPKAEIDKSIGLVIPESHVDLKSALSNTGIKLAPRERETEKTTVNCGTCGAFNSERQVYLDGCPKCGANNRP